MIKNKESRLFNAVDLSETQSLLNSFYEIVLLSRKPKFKKMLIDYFGYNPHFFNAILWDVYDDYYLFSEIIKHLYNEKFSNQGNLWRKKYFTTSKTHAKLLFQLRKAGTPATLINNLKKEIEAKNEKIEKLQKANSILRANKQKQRSKKWK